MRKSFDGLCGIVQAHMGLDPMDGSVYLFINRRRNKMKMLVWETGGFMLYYKRLEQGTFELPERQENQASISLAWEVLAMIITGVKIDKIIRKKRYEKV